MAFRLVCHCIPDIASRMTVHAKVDLLYSVINRWYSQMFVAPKNKMFSGVIIIFLLLYYNIIIIILLLLYIKLSN